MELTYLIENYTYLKFLVDVYEEYSKKHEISDDIMFRKIKSKYEEAKTFLSFIETAITMLPINKRSNYNNQYEVVYRKSYIEKMKIKAISDLLNTSIRNAYSIRRHAMNMIEERVDLFFDYRYRIEKLDAPQNYPVAEVFDRCNEAVTNDYYNDFAGSDRLYCLKRQVGFTLTKSRGGLSALLCTDDCHIKYNQLRFRVLNVETGSNFNQLGRN